MRTFGEGERKQTMFDPQKYKHAAKGDLAYNMMRMWQGALGVSPADGLVSPAYVVARPFEDVEARYYAYLFRTDAYLGEVDKYSRGIVKDRNRLYWEDFKRIPSLYPPRDEQAAIVRFLDHADRQIKRYIRAKRKLISLLNEQKQVIIYQAVIRGLDPNVRLNDSDVDWLGDVPGHWEIWKISHLAQVGNGSTPSRGNQEYWYGGTYPWLNSASVNQSPIVHASQQVTELALKECHLPRVSSGSVLVAITGQGKTRGTSALLNIEATINQHLVYITPKLDVVSPEFLHLTLVAAYSELRRISEDAGSTKGALTCYDISSFKVAIPPLEEQKKLHDFVRKESAVIENSILMIEKQVDLLLELRTRLISDVVTGRVDVREAADQLPEMDESDQVLDETEEEVEEPTEANAEEVEA